MSKLRTPGSHPLDTGGFLSFSVVADGFIVLILTYFATHTLRRAVGLLTGESSAAGWIPVVVASTIMVVLFPLIVGRLWSQLSTRYTTQGVSQWRFLSYRSLAWPEIVRVYYDRQGLILEGQTRAIRIIASCYRDPEQMLRVVHAHLSYGANQPVRPATANVTRIAAVSEFPTEGARANSA